ncbi:TonB-dependent receptor [Flammeovirgaceae bacterium SG7u.111]|nr:TonB-dependent receptor [Flammeovirgaceae bacterium SG7u.132]WPO38426.1 TonB-dependent receptor [Flammeovirgaceae bacterium SG7u.111]
MKIKVLLQIWGMAKYMFYGVLIQVFLSSFLMPEDSLGQKGSIYEIKLSLNVDEAGLTEVFQEIEHKTGFAFTYFEGELNQQMDSKFNFKFNNKSLGFILGKVSSKTGLAFKRINDNISVSPSYSSLAYVEEKSDFDVVQQKVTGRVLSEEDGEPLPGVSIIVKGTSTGTTTDIEGEFSLDVIDGAVLQFSYIGFVTQEVVVGTQTQINVSLLPDLAQLEEVIVVGYGTQKRSDITGSVASVPKERLSNLPVTNVLQAIQGTTAGLNITQTSSVPGSSANIQIRGVNSINANTSPFIVLDGVPFFGVTNDINPNDIESIEILKDASAVAIYGTRGANGVILITTKRGSSLDNKPTIRYNGYVGFEGIANKLTPMGPDQYVQKYADFMEANDLDQTTVLPNAAEIENYNNGVTSDWLDLATQPGKLTEHNLSISGSTNNLQYYVSGSRLSQDGVIKGYEFKKTTFRTNIDATINPFIKVGTSAYFAENNSDGGRVNLLEATAMSPYSVPTDEDGNNIIYPMAPEQLFENPLLGLSVDRVDRQRNLTGTGYAEITPIEGLKYKLNASYTYKLSRFSQYSGRQNNDNSGTANINNWENLNWVVENILTYTKDINKHHFDVTALYSAQEVSDMGVYATSRVFINDALSYKELSAGTSQSTDSYSNSYTLLSQMGRLNYSYDGRYLLTLTARRDGYSAFGSNTDKYGLFPSMALGWNIANEAFAQDVSWLDQLKLRFSYGQSGNQAIGVYQTASTAATVRYPFGGTALTGVLYDKLGNSNLNWETTTGSNLALDFGVIQSRINGTIEVYKTVTNDILLRRSLPGITGYTNVWDNLGKMQNVGFEFTLNTVNVSTDDFTWETNLNFSTFKNEIVELYGDGQDDVGNRWFIGQPLRIAYDYEKIGIWQEGEDAASSDPVAKPGDLKFKDQDGDGQITADDRVILGRTDPKWIGGMTNTFKYKNFNLRIFLQTSQGGLRSNRDLTYADEAGRRNLPDGFQYWTPENPSNYWPSLSAYKNYRGYGFNEDYSYVRIKDVTFSYNIPNTLLEKYKIKGLTVYATGRNLYTFTDWFGWDPEMSYSSRGSDNWTNNYPLTRTISFGVNLSL